MKLKVDKITEFGQPHQTKTHNTKIPNPIVLRKYQNAPTSSTENPYNSYNR